MRFLYLLIFPLLPLYADYCIQALSSDAAHENLLFQEKQKSCYQGLDKVRVESRPPYYTLRIGRYNRYHDGLKDLEKVKACQKSAFLRNCNFQDFPNQDTEHKVIEKQIPIEEPYHILPEIQEVQESTKKEITKSSPPSRKIQTTVKKTIVKESYPTLPPIQEVQTITEPKQIKKTLPLIQKTTKTTETTKPTTTTTTTIVTTKTVTTKVEQMPVWDACQKCFAPMYQEE